MVAINNNSIKIAKRYKHPKITICRRCAGTGVYQHLDADEREEVSEVCPDCQGSGRLVVSGVSEFTVQPYVPGTMLFRGIECSPV